MSRVSIQPLNEHISIVGAGMLGSSIALAAQNAGFAVSMYVRRESALKEAESIGLSNVSNDLKSATQNTDLIILATPVGAMPELAMQLVKQGLPENCLVTDIGSVKQMVHDSVASIFKNAGIDFLGSHPMAGSEKTGILAADETLLKGAMCLLTEQESISKESAKTRLEEFWQSLGCKTQWLGAEEHDQAVARISHLPHILAAVAAHQGLENPEFAAFAAGGFRDTTRVAAGDPCMWTEILLENREAVSDSLRGSIDLLQEMLRMLEKSDADQLHHILKIAQQRRYHYHQTLIS